MKYFCLCLLIGVGTVLGTENDTDNDELIPDEQRLYQEIMHGYEIAVRPVVNTTGVIEVKFGLRLHQIIGLDERHQVFTTNVFIEQIWEDASLSWDPSKFNNVRSIRIPSTKVWLPDTFIYNNADGGSTGFLTGQYVLVNNDGEVLWPVPVKLRSSCQVNIKYFPFDDQQCILRFGSWIYNNDAIRFRPLKEENPIDMSVYVNNSEWELLSVSLERSQRQESSCIEPHIDLVYKLNIRRRTFFYVFNVIIPCVMLSVLTLLTFWVPATSGEKVTLGLSVFLAFSMFMLLIAEEVPASSESVPLIGIYLCCVMTMTSFSVIMAVLIINLYNRGVRTPRAPAWLRFLCLRFLSTLLRISHDVNTIAETITLEEEKDDLQEKSETTKRRQVKQSDKNEKAFCQEPGPSANFHCTEVHPRKVHRTSITSRKHGWLEFDRHCTGIFGERSLDSCNFHGSTLGNESGPQAAAPSTSHLRDADTHDCTLEQTANDSEHSDSDKHYHKAEATFYQADKYHDSNGNPCKEEDEALLSTADSDKTKTTPEELFQKKVTIVEWQRIAAVIDRLLFWVFFLGTLTAYVIILVIIPGNKKLPLDEQISTLHAILHQS